MQLTDFGTDIKKGTIGEKIFKDDFLDFLNIKYEDVSGCQAYQIKGTDFIFPLGRVDIKNSYKSYENTIIIEEYTNHGLKTPGWFDTSHAHMFVFVDCSARHMVFVPNTENFHGWYSVNKDAFKLCYNKMTYGANGSWQSSFRVVKLEFIPHSFYYKGYLRGHEVKNKGCGTFIQLVLEDSLRKNVTTPGRECKNTPPCSRPSATGAT